MKKVRIKFCGGCNPEYDRMAVAEHIRLDLEAAGYRVETGNGKGDLAVVVCGCACACADVSGLECDRMITVTGPPPRHLGLTCRGDRLVALAHGQPSVGPWHPLKE